MARGIVAQARLAKSGPFAPRRYHECRKETVVFIDVIPLLTRRISKPSVTFGLADRCGKLRDGNCKQSWLRRRRKNERSYRGGIQGGCKAIGWIAAGICGSDPRLLPPVITQSGSLVSGASIQGRHGRRSASADHTLGSGRNNPGARLKRSMLHSIATHLPPERIAEHPTTTTSPLSSSAEVVVKTGCQPELERCSGSGFGIQHSIEQPEHTMAFQLPSESEHAERPIAGQQRPSASPLFRGKSRQSHKEVRTQIAAQPGTSS
jgi:hypothetical protein